MTLLARLGDRPVSAARDAVRVAALLGHAPAAPLRMLHRPGARDVLARQILFTGVEAVPFALLLGLLAGFAIAVQGRLLGEGTVGGPLLVALVVAALAAKTLVPGAFVAAIACDEGLAARTASDIPPAVSRTAVRAIVAVLLWDALVTGLLFLR